MCSAYQLWFLGKLLDLFVPQYLHAQDGVFMVLPLCDNTRIQWNLNEEVSTLRTPSTLGSALSHQASGEAVGLIKKFQSQPSRGPCCHGGGLGGGLAQTSGSKKLVQVAAPLTWVGPPTGHLSLCLCFPLCKMGCFEPILDCGFGNTLKSIKY